MADDARVRVLEQGPRNITVHMVSVSDGTGESAVVKVDRSTLTGPDGVTEPSLLIPERIQWTITGHGRVRLGWNNGVGEDFFWQAGPGWGDLDFRGVGGLHAAEGPGLDPGDIILTTGSEAINGYYGIVLWMRKKS